MKGLLNVMRAMLLTTAGRIVSAAPVVRHNLTGFVRNRREGSCRLIEDSIIDQSYIHIYERGLVARMQCETTARRDKILVNSVTGQAWTSPERLG